MFKIGKLFHLTHVVHDLDAVDQQSEQFYVANESCPICRDG
jgi:hypothetical protein